MCSFLGEKSVLFGKKDKNIGLQSINTVVKSLYSLTKYNKTFQKLQKKENK